MKATEIDPPVKLRKTNDVPEDRELDRWKEAHNACDEGYTFFKLDVEAHKELRESCCVDGSPTDDQLTQYEKQLLALYINSTLSDRAAILSRPTFDGRLEDLYEQRCRTPFESLPFVVIPHSAIELIELDDEVGFISYVSLSTALRQLSSYLISSTSMDLAKISMIEMRRHIKDSFTQRAPELLFCVHDELVYEVPEEHVREFTLKLLQVMQTSPSEFDAKVTAAAEIGPSYGQIEEVTEDQLLSKSWTPSDAGDFCQQPVSGE